MALIRSKKSSFGESSVTLKNEMTPTQYSSSQIRTGGGSNDPGRVKNAFFHSHAYAF